jgi:DNA-binding transcriptional MerR regulator
MKALELAKSLNTTVHTVRFYTKRSLLNPEIDLSNGYKHYSIKDQRRLKFILCSRELGFSVNDIRMILEESDKGKSPCPLVRDLIEDRLNETEERFLEVLKLRQRMKVAISEWEALPDAPPDGDSVCRLIENFFYPSLENR